MRRPISSGERGYSNWELSADRANASRRELIAGGMDERKVLRVVGLASAVLFDRADPFAPVNRRISIVVLNKRAESSMSRDEAGREVSGTEFTGAPDRGGMSKEELRREAKESEGDPHLKARIRAQQREVARRRMMSARRSSSS
jgi:hypothetical protein